MDNDTATEANELQVHPLKEEQDMLLRTIWPSLVSNRRYGQKYGGCYTRSMMEVFL